MDVFTKEVQCQVSHYLSSDQPTFLSAPTPFIRSLLCCATTELAEFPYLLPTKHPFTKLIIYATHEKQLHEFYTDSHKAMLLDPLCTSARQVIRKLLRHCVICQKIQGKPYQTPHSSRKGHRMLNPSNLQELISLMQGRGGICLFTCAVNRAVHLEIVTDLPVEIFLQAFRRFSSHKSLPKILISGNASTYMAEELLTLFDSPLLTETLNKKGVVEIYPKTCPLVSWYEVFWKCLIGLTKSALKKVLG